MIQKDIVLTCAQFGQPVSPEQWHEVSSSKAAISSSLKRGWTYTNMVSVSSYLQNKKNIQLHICHSHNKNMASVSSYLQNKNLVEIKNEHLGLDGMESHVDSSNTSPFICPTSFRCNQLNFRICSKFLRAFC